MKHISIKVEESTYANIKTLSMIDDGGGDISPYVRLVLERHIKNNMDRIEEFREMVKAPLSGEPPAPIPPSMPFDPGPPILPKEYPDGERDTRGIAELLMPD